MTQARKIRVVVTAAVGVATTIGLLGGVGDAYAAKKNKKNKRAAQVIQMQTPLGLQGTRGAGPNVVTPFSLLDKSRKKSDIQAEYGWDINNDGVIADGTDPALPSEYVSATEDRRDPRNTRKNKKPQLFTTAGDIGASHAFVWNSTADVTTGHFPTLQFLYTQDGRPVPDPNNPGSILFDETLAGMKVRVRAKSKKGGGVGEWVYTDAFALNNNTPPSMTIDGVVPNDTSTPTASDEVVEINWTAFDEDSEDLNGNGVLDPLDLEDVNGNGQLDPEFLAVAFDYWRVPEGIDPATMSQSELEALLWLPCTRAEGFGTDPSAPSELRIDGYPSAPQPVGRSHVWAWNSVADVGTVKARFILRARPFDQKRELGQIVYFKDGFQLDNWKIFNHPGAASDLPAGRVGTASVNLTPGLTRSDPAYEPPLQSILLTGGSQQDGGAGTTYLAVQIINTETAETTTSSAALFTSLIDARSYHTATVLDDGRVLLTGGFDASGSALATTEIYDPATHNVSPGPNLLSPRARHAAVRLASGDVAIFGGTTGSGAISSCELFRFTPEGAPPLPNVALPDLATAQHSLHAKLLPNQKVLVTGGISASSTPVQTAQVLNPLNDDDVSDPTTKNPVFEDAGQMNEARMHASATTLSNGHVLFAGGAASPSKTSLELYNWRVNAFEPINGAQMEVGRAQHSAVLLGDGTVVLAGGISDPSGGTVIADADVFVLGDRAIPDPNETAVNPPSSSWTGSFLPVNGDMRVPRRNAEGIAINNGRAFFIGGQDATGNAIPTLETYTPENGTNSRPSARTDLASKQQSWAFGAPIVYRTVDPEQDDCRVVVQWSDNAGAVWNAAAPQFTTIGGNVSEPTAPITTGLVDDQAVKIDPGSFPQSDHHYIWGMTRDIPRPPVGGSSGPYIFRTIPFGAVQGPGSQSVPVTVLYNTKVIPTIIALEDDGTGVQNPNQGGDIGIWVHLRDIDGPGTGPRNGDVARAMFEFAVDANNNGIIDDGLEFWNPASATTAGVNPAAQGANGANVLEPLQTWSEAPEDSDPINRPASMGWVFFDWDSLYDLGAPQDSWGNIWFRIRPFDNIAAAQPDEGFTANLRNESGQPESFRVIRDPQALWLNNMTAQGGNNAAVAINEPIEFFFNGLVDAASVSPATIQISRNGAPILGVFTTTNDVASHTSLVTFYPRPNNTILDQLEYTEGSNPTVLFPLNEYEVLIPGYPAQTDPTIDIPPTLRPITSGFPQPVQQTYLLAQNVPISTTFTTRTGNYDDGQDPVLGAITPISGSTLLKDGTVSFAYDKALDLNTVKAPNVVVTIDNAGGSTAAVAGRPVVAGQWSVTNSQNADGSTSSVMEFTPFIQLPSGQTVEVQSNAGLHGENGRSVGTISTSYTIDPFGTQSVTSSETFTNNNQEDASGTTADWANDPCSPGVLTGLQDGSTQPQGGSDYVVAAGQIRTLTAQESDFNDFTVEKGGKLLVRSTTGTVTIRAAGNISILGTVDFRGEDGWTGHFGNTTTRVYYLYATRGIGTRKGGRAYNGGNDGGDSDSNRTTVRVPGDDGQGSTGGQGGQVATAGSTGSYTYGSGGGAGGGHGQPGLAGGPAQSRVNNSRYGPKSLPGGIAGSADMPGGPSVGGGGGGGGSNRYSSVWYHGGGGGGASAGAITFLCDGTFDLGPSGMIDGRGGRGGSSAPLAGSGGGGAGGGLLVKSGGKCTLDGVIDLRGGLGGPAAFGTWNDFYAQTSAFTNGTSRYGGDGGPGRLRVEAPNFLNHDEVRVKGQLMISQVTSIPTSGMTAVSPPAGWQTNNATVTLTGGEVRYTQLIVPAGVTVNVAGTQATTIYVDGEVRIDGTVRLNGARPTRGFSGSATNGMSGTAPEFDGGAGTPATQYVGGVGVLGGGSGGPGHTIGGSATSTNEYKRQGTDGKGPKFGRAHSDASTGYAWSGNNYILYSGDVGGGGGTNATEGDDGWSPYALASRYEYSGAVTDSSGDGLSPDDVNTAQQDTTSDRDASKHDRLDPSNINESNLASFVGSGAGGGNLGGYSYTRSNWHYFGMTGSAGSGAGALGIVGAGTVTVNGSIEAKGGDGNPPGAPAMLVTQWNWSTSTRSSMGYAHSGGGAGSGGSVYIVGDNVNIAPVTIGEGAGANGATIDVQGGLGGGWRQFRNSGNSNRYPAYNSAGNFGGNGGFGRAVIRYRTSLNGGRQLFNRWGMEQSVFENDNQRYTVLAGTATAACRGLPGGDTFQSGWYDLDSYVPVVNRIAPAIATNVNFTLLGEGAQSHPFNPGTGGTGEADPANTSGFQSTGTAMLDGWRWLRWNGTISRPTTDPADPAPILDNMEWDYRTDQ